MLSLSRILLPIDFSDQCRGMLPYARAVAERYSAEITLLHVANPFVAIPATGMAGPELIPMPRSVFAQKTGQMDGFGADELQGLTVRRLIYEGDPTEQIVGFIETEHMQLVAMPTHGLGVLRRFLIGSVTAKVLHDAPCPVLTSVHMDRPPHHLPVTFSNIVCAVDLGGKSQDTLGWAAQFASDFQARLTIVHAVPALSPGFELSFGGDWKNDVANLAREDVERLQTAVGSHASGIYIEEGQPAKTVCSFAKSSGADLLVIGRGSQEGLTGRLRTNAYAIIRESPCPVVTV
jgi:nucleotide-binding universal stress UspA family protein